MSGGANLARERFARNATGRDFVVGDVHGCFDQLEHALARLAFDPARDRCFCVGDLTDRGPLSHRALEWLARPWFFSCRGNHDEMVVSDSLDPDALLWWITVNGGQWWLELDETERERFRRRFAQLPLTLEVETVHGRVGVVHADVPQGMSWPAFVTALQQGDAAARHAALWSRERIEGRYAGRVAGIDRVVCGHTPLREVAVRDNVWFIDTGAFLGPPDGHLTLLPLAALFAGGPPWQTQ